MALKSYSEMRKIDVKPFCEKRDGIDYLNWAMCIKLLHDNGAEHVYCHSQAITCFLVWYWFPVNMFGSIVVQKFDAHRPI